MKSKSLLTIRSVAAALTLCLTVGLATPLMAVTTTLDLYRLGENDPGAATGNTGNATTTDAVGPNDLSRTGTPSYTNDTIAYQSSLAMKFGNSSPERLRHRKHGLDLAGQLWHRSAGARGRWLRRRVGNCL